MITTTVTDIIATALFIVLISIATVDIMRNDEQDTTALIGFLMFLFLLDGLVIFQLHLYPITI